ncbi:hypothetical protein CfE428DRAFT_5787 [Chthoniobacter flavus Ellin428]|uniref:Uncharacterized protein n=1 Tax=Chthoniobacter flavus Ellin428 TaxID=497964 RepID=B4DA47_9BACT|nr:hypothetical protein [Chthoniobacter flavus]EDY16674.1 hypothetical protein CfE428DRAFT_5787 [Chthoniobacter flavus Ellin428]TCO87248.1 hypothetical protein EV701_12385 [Chthoniobacter flavus]
MRQLITINLTTRNSDWVPPVLTFGESLTLQIRFTKTINGNPIEPNLSITGSKASFGNVDARPGGGKFALCFNNGNPDTNFTTADLSHDCTATQMQSAINAKTAVTGAYGTAAVKKVEGSWLIRFGAGAVQVPIQIVDNSLWPVSFADIRAGTQIDNLWLHEVRLTQAPVAFVGGPPSIGLPSLPSFSVKIHGGAGSGQVWDTVQQLSIPSDFRGTYRIVKDNIRTELLAEDASADTIQAALVAALGSGIVVTLPFSQRFYVDLGGKYAGTDVAELTVEGGDAPAQDLFLTIPFDRLELASMLRSQPSVTLPLEIRIDCTEDGTGDPQEIVALYTQLTVQRPVALPILDSLATIDWLRLPSPKTYVGPGTANTLVGKVARVFSEQGDGATTVFDLAHDLATSDVEVFVRIDGANGVQLKNGVDYSAAITDDNHVTVTALTGAPAAGTWRISVIGFVDTAVWADDLTIAEDQVTNLPTDLSALQTAVTELQTLLPANASLPSGIAPSNATTIQLQPFSQILFAKDATGAPITDPTKLPTTKPPFLLPALNTTTSLGALPTSPLPDPAAGALYTTAAATLIPGGGHIRSSMSEAGGYVISDGRMNYPARKSGSKDSYYPIPFEIPIFGGTDDILINDMMFPAGKTLTFLGKLSLQILKGTSEAEYLFVIEQGLITQETTPGTPDANLLDITWQTATPLVSQIVRVGPAIQTFGFGCTIANTNGTVFTANGMIYQRVLSATANVQQTANFALRAMFRNFDTKNSVTDARGWLSWSLLQPDNGILGISIS